MYNSYVSESQKELERKISKELSLENAFELLKKQVKIGERLSGTPEALEEANLIKATLEEYGMKTKMLEFKTHISVPVKTEFRVISPKAEAIEAEAFSWSAETPPEGVEGELVFVGFGKEEDYQNKDVRGKIAFASLGGPISRARKTEICMSKGAKAFLTFNNLPDGPIQRGTCKSVMGNPTPELLGPPYVPDRPIITVDHRNGLRIVEMCKNGPVKVWLRTKMDQGWKNTYAVETTLRGTIEPEKFVMLAAHYDSWGPQGVECNAVGVAGLLELARVFNQYKDQLRRSIRFVFWGAHELGMGAGGAWYIDNHWDEIQSHLVLYSMHDTISIKDPTVLISNQTPELHPFHKDLLNEVGLPSYIKKIEFGIPRGGADISTFTLYPCVTVMRDLAARDYGIFIERSDFVHTARDTLELADPNMFEPAFRTLPAAYLRFCNLPILPLDYSVNGNMMLNHLNNLKKEGKGIIDLELSIQYTEMFNQEYTLFSQTAKKALEAYLGARGSEKERLNKVLDVINTPLIRLSRILNRVLISDFLKWEQYSAGLYVNDFDEGILAARSIPSLEPMRKLINLNPESDEYGALLTRLVRNRNKTADALRIAMETTKSAREEAERLLGN